MELDKFKQQIWEALLMFRRNQENRGTLPSLILLSYDDYFQIRSIDNEYRFVPDKDFHLMGVPCTWSSIIDKETFKIYKEWDLK